MVCDNVGTGPSCYLAEKVGSQRGVAGMILHSPFLSVCRIVVDTSWSLEMGEFFIMNVDCS